MAVEQLTAIGALLGATGQSAAEVATAFESADPKLVAEHLETLALMGEIGEEGGKYVAGRKVA